MDKEILKLKEEHLIALIRGTKIAVMVQGICFEILPPVYDDHDRFVNAFEMGREVQKQAMLYLDLVNPNH